MWKRIRLTLEMIKFEHSVFALPFALTGALLAIRHSGLSARAASGKIGWIVVAMVGARSAAMAFNRLIDLGFDARNPRTRMRHLPTGVLSRGFTWGFVAVSALVFVFVQCHLLMEALPLHIRAELQMVRAAEMHRRQKQVGRRLLPVPVPIRAAEVIAAIARRRDL